MGQLDPLAPFVDRVFSGDGNRSRLSQIGVDSDAQQENSDLVAEKSIVK